MKDAEVNEITVNDAKEVKAPKLTSYKPGNNAVIIDNNESIVGKIKEVISEENGKQELLFKPFKGDDLKVIDNTDPKLEPLFFENKQSGYRTNTDFSFKEIDELLKNDKFYKLDYNTLKNERSAITNLMLGNKTGVIKDMVIEPKTEIDGEKAGRRKTVEGRLFLKRDHSGKPQALIDFKQDLKIKDVLEKPVYGTKLTTKEKNQLLKTGELGLKSFTTKEGKPFNAWVGLDKELNKIITRSEKSIRTDKFYGTSLNEAQQKDLKSGKPVLVENQKGQKTVIAASTASTQKNGLLQFTYDYALKNKIIEQPKKNKAQKVK